MSMQWLHMVASWALRELTSYKWCRYKAYIGHITQRTNTINGLQYNNDSTILAWELLNEPRCQVAQGCSPGTVAVRG